MILLILEKKLCMTCTDDKLVGLSKLQCPSFKSDLQGFLETKNMAYISNALAIVGSYRSRL